MVVPACSLFRWTCFGCRCQFLQISASQEWAQDTSLSKQGWWQSSNKHTREVCSLCQRDSENLTLSHRRWTEGCNSRWSSSDSMGCNACSMALQPVSSSCDNKGDTISISTRPTLPWKISILWPGCLWSWSQSNKVQTSMEERLLAGKRYIRDGPHLHRWPNHHSNKSGQEDQQSMGCWTHHWYDRWTDGLLWTSSHRQVKAKQKLMALASPGPQMIDEEAKVVRDQTLSDGYSASKPLDDSDQAQRHDQTNWSSSMGGRWFGAC